jgi:hypothetical protein
VTAAPLPIDTAGPVSPGASRVPVRRERLIGVAVLVAGIALVTALSQLHHHYAPDQAGGWRELPTYAVAGVLGWGVAFGIAFIAPHRAAAPAPVSRRVGLGLGVVGIAAAALLWWTPIPFCLGAAGALLISRARRLGGPSRWDVLGYVLAGMDVVLPLAIFALRIAADAR